jgi:lipopolysaccharide transport system permease protein
VGFGARILLAPAVLLLILLISQGVGTWLAALAVKYRDVAQVMPVLLQLLLYASPVAYAVSAIPDRYVTFYRLNPLTPLLEAFRWTVLGTARPPAGSLLYAAAVAVVVSIAGVAALKRMEGAFADVI